MKAKNKIIISIVSLAVTLVVALGVTFGVLAAQQQSVQNQFTVSYVANNVAATVRAGYRVGDNGQMTYFTNGGNDYLTFSPTDSSTAQNPTTLTGPNNITLSPQNDYAMLFFEYTNTASVGGRYVQVRFDHDNTTKTNLISKYFLGPSTNIYENTIMSYGYSYASAQGEVIYVAPQETYYWCMIVKIQDQSLDASMVSAASQLQFTMTAVDDATQEWFELQEQIAALYNSQNN